VVNEEYIVEQAVNGNQAAFTQLYDLYFNRIYRYVYVRIRKQAEAEDLTQEVFIKALKAIGAYKIGKTPFAAWLFRIAHNQVIDYVRKYAKNMETSLDEAPPSIGAEDPVAMIEQKFEIAELNAAMMKLSPAQQEVISLRFIAELPISDVARILGKREGTVKALQFNGTVSLRKLLVGRIQ
jgi:RNA polymerase sigma-70 factor (ECF subfamily)